MTAQSVNKRDEGEENTKQEDGRLYGHKEDREPKRDQNRKGGEEEQLASKSCNKRDEREGDTKSWNVVV